MQCLPLINYTHELLKHVIVEVCTRLQRGGSLGKLHKEYGLTDQWVFMYKKSKEAPVSRICT